MSEESKKPELRDLLAGLERTLVEMRREREEFEAQLAEAVEKLRQWGAGDGK